MTATAAKEKPITEQWLRSMGFDGPHFDLDRLRLEYGRLRITNYRGWNLHVRSQEDERGWYRIINDLKSRHQILLALELFAEAHP